MNTVKNDFVCKINFLKNKTITNFILLTIYSNYLPTLKRLSADPIQMDDSIINEVYEFSYIGRMVTTDGCRKEYKK